MATESGYEWFRAFRPGLWTSRRRAQEERMRDGLIRRLLRRYPEIAVECWASESRSAARKHGPDSAQALVGRQNRAIALFRGGHRAEAEAEFAAVIAGWESMTDGGDETRLDLARQWHARTLQELKRYAEAEPALAALTASAKSRGDGDLARDARRWRAHALYNLGRVEEAEAEYRTVADEDARVLGPVHPEALRHRQAHARLLAELERYHEAETELADVIARRTEAGDTSRRSAPSY